MERALYQCLKCVNKECLNVLFQIWKIVCLPRSLANLEVRPVLMDVSHETIQKCGHYKPILLKKIAKQDAEFAPRGISQ